jgi:hypothetical protein
MKQTFEQYCQQLSAEAAQLSQEVEMRESIEHLGAYNSGRAVQRLEDVQHDLSAQAGLWVRVRWLLIGVAIGAAFAAVFVQVWQLHH